MKPTQRYNPNVDRIVRAVAHPYGIEPSLVLASGKGTATVRKVRNLSMHVARIRYGYSTTELGTFFGRDPSTCSYDLRRADELLARCRFAAETVRLALEEPGRAA